MATKMYRGSGVNTYIIEVNGLFSDMEKLYPGFSSAMFNSTITEDLTYLQGWLQNIEDTEAFARWLGIVFSDCAPTDDLAVILPRRMSDIYNKISQIVVERLRGLPIYVIGYVNGDLLLASQSTYSVDSLQNLLGGLV